MSVGGLDAAELKIEYGAPPMDLGRDAYRSERTERDGPPRRRRLLLCGISGCRPVDDDPERRGRAARRGRCCIDRCGPARGMLRWRLALAASATAAPVAPVPSRMRPARRLPPARRTPRPASHLPP